MQGLTPWPKFLLEKPIVTQLPTFTVFYGTRKSIAVFTRTCHLFLSGAGLSVQVLLSFLFKFTFNIILPSIPRSHKSFPLPFRVPGRNSLFLVSDMLNIWFNQPMLLDLITLIMLSEKYR
jgi:hypothetical protein